MEINVVKCFRYGYKGHIARKCFSRKLLQEQVKRHGNDKNQAQKNQEIYEKNKKPFNKPTFNKHQEKPEYKKDFNKDKSEKMKEYWKNKKKQEKKNYKKSNAIDRTDSDTSDNESSSDDEKTCSHIELKKQNFKPKVLTIKDKLNWKLMDNKYVVKHKKNNQKTSKNAPKIFVLPKNE